MGFKFEDLRVWNEAVDYSTLVSTEIRKWPSEEKFVLSSQFQRVADSVALNIAEGSTEQSNKEFARFLAIALRSGIECVTCIHLAVRRKLIDRESFELHYEKLQHLTKGIQALRKAILSKN